MNTKYFIRGFVSAMYLFLMYGAIYAQRYTISGTVMDNGAPIQEAPVFLKPVSLGTISNEHGSFVFDDLMHEKYVISISYIGYAPYKDTFSLTRDTTLTIELQRISYVLENVNIEAAEVSDFGITRLRAVEGSAIYASKKSEVIHVDKLNANLAANLSRQVYAKVPGLNIWESDGAGVQLGIGGRGLSPSRNSNFNTRQNGYDISADALGYPESYYTPPVEAIQRIEIVRGAASLQYGTQFGGLLNFKFREGPRHKKFSIRSRQSVGSFGFFSSYNEIGGTIGKVNYTTFYQYKHSDGWRPNSTLNQHTGYVSLQIRVSPQLLLRPEVTIMRYLARQPGGLTDAQFEMDPGQSNRERNWFNVNWNLAALTLDYTINNKTLVNSRFFGLIAGRDALGVLSNINLADFGGERDLLKDQFRNWGNETRFIYKYSLLTNPSTLLLGFRYYQGFTHRRQGNGSDGKGPDFDYLNPGELKGSDYDLPSRNFSIFAENIFTLGEKVSITPGVRFEYIHTAADGYYRNTVKDLADNILTDEKIYESRINNRSFIFTGIGMSYKPSDNLEVYSNISQNYRAINFNDIRVNAGNLVVDENIDDERGFNADIGFRGSWREWLSFDISAFHLNYKDRIGTVLKSEPNPNFNNLVNRVVRFRTNVAAARIYGLELYSEVSIYKILSSKSPGTDLSLFINMAVIKSEYVDSKATAIEGNSVELVPKLNTKVGINARHGRFSASFQVTYVSEQFSDATNAIRTANAVEGIIPSYGVADLSVGYSHKVVTFEAGINNLTNHSYFTRRASGYPGPGIIPAEPRSLYLTIGIAL